MQKLTYLAIQNYRPCQNTSFPLGDFTALVGYNNVGKSAILTAAEWLFEHENLDSKDFHTAGQPVSVIGKIEGIDEAILNKLTPKHKTAITPYCPGGILWVRRSATSPKDRADINVWDVAQYTGNGVPVHWHVNPGGIPQAIAALFPKPIRIPAMQIVPDDLCKSKANTTIQSLLNEVVKPIYVRHGAELTDLLKTLHKKIGRDGEEPAKELADFDKDASEDLDDFFPGLRLHLDFPPLQLKELFSAEDLKILEGQDDRERPLASLGHGAQRAIQIALIKYLSSAQRKSEATASRRLLLIDEPELYLHPQGVEQVRIALKSLSEDGYQVIFSTHSPQMLHREDAASTIIVRKNENGTKTGNPLAQAVKDAIQDGPHQARSLFTLTNAAQIFFSDKVLLAEGKTEGRFFPILHEKLLGGTPAAKKLAIVPLNAGGDIAPSLKVLKAMTIQVKAVADLDYAFTRAEGCGFIDLAALTPNLGPVVARLAGALGFTLNGIFPQKGNGWTAAEAWAEFAKDPEGKAMCELAFEELKKHGVYVWRAGTIEDVLGIAGKGESEIQKVEADLTAMTNAQAQAAYPEILAMFNWVYA